MANNFKKWTIFFLIRGEIGTWDAALKMMDSLLKVDIDPSIAVIVCLNVITSRIPDNYPRGTNPSGYKMTTLFYEIKDKKRLFIDELGKFNIKEEKDVAAYFREKVLHRCPAEKYMLFTWDHGTNFGIFHYPDPFSASGQKISIKDGQDLSLLLNIEDNQQVSKLLLTDVGVEDYFEKQATQHLNDSQYTELMNEIKLVSANLDMLTITDLLNAITQAFGNKKIDVIIMFNCFQQFFDTGYELSSCADYLVTFETVMNYKNDLDYSRIFEKLSAESNISSEEIARYVVNSFAAKKPGDAKGKNETVFIANDLSWYPFMAELIDELAIAMINNLEDYFGKIQDARSKCKYLPLAGNASALIDFKNFFLSLCNNAPGLIPAKLIVNMLWCFNKIVLEKYVGQKYQNEKGNKTISPSGFSVYFPDKSKDYYGTANLKWFFRHESPYATAFTQKFQWNNFIAKYIDNTEKFSMS